MSYVEDFRPDAQGRPRKAEAVEGFEVRDPKGSRCWSRLLDPMFCSAEFLDKGEIERVYLSTSFFDSLSCCFSLPRRLDLVDMPPDATSAQPHL